jgi:hypothetical protein
MLAVPAQTLEPKNRIFREPLSSIFEKKEERAKILGWDR